VTGLELGSVYLVDPASRVATLAAWRGLPREIAARFRQFQPGESLVGRVAQSGTPIIETDITGDRRVTSPIASDMGAVSFAAIPMHGPDGVGGVLAVASRRPHDFDRGQVRLLGLVADQVGIALRHGRVFNECREELRRRAATEKSLKRAMKALDAERRRSEATTEKVVLSHENERRHLMAMIHDELLQSLVANFYFLKMLSPAALDRRLRGRRDELIAFTKASIERGRRMMHEVEPIDGRSAGLARMVRRRIDLVFPEGGARVELRHPPRLPRIGAATKINIVRIVQEALANARRHARATKVTVDIQATDDRLDFEVRDDGVGFVPARALRTAAGHYGLLIMRDRARMIGGELTIASRPGRGTMIRCSVPLRLREGKR